MTIIHFYPFSFHKQIELSFLSHNYYYFFNFDLFLSVLFFISNKLPYQTEPNPQFYCSLKVDPSKKNKNKIKKIQ